MTAIAIPSTPAIIPLTTNENSNTVFTTVVTTQAKLPPAYYSPIEPTTATSSSIESIQVKPETSDLFAELCQSVIIDNQPFAANKTGQRVTSLTAPTTSFQVISQPVQNSCKTDAPGKDKNRKKNKLKPITKTRTIKFHEYKGPPNAQKNGLLSLQPEETSYQLLLKQQNCLLEYLEGLHKNLPSTATVNNTKPNVQSETQTFTMTNNFMQQASPAASSTSSTKPASPVSNVSDPNILELSKLEKMKVSDLKLLLKTRNLPVSGPKPQLIERLRPFAQQDVGDMITSENGIMEDDNDTASRISPISMETDSIVEMHEPMPKSKSNVDLLREQQRKIDELQRKLKESQQELHQMQMKQSQSSTAVILTQNDVVSNKTETLNQKQIFKQQLEAKIQKDKLQKLENLQKLQMEQQQQQQKQQEMQRRKQGNLKKKQTRILTLFL